MKKKQNIYHKPLLLLLTLLLGCMGQSASAFNFNGLNYAVTSESSKTVKVDSQNKSTSLTGSVNIPATVTYNGSTYTVTKIEDNAFIECKNITGIIVPGTVTIIGNGSFAFCSSLATLDLGAGVTTIGNDIYTGLSKLGTVISRNPTPPSIGNWGTVRTNATLYVPANAINAYKNASIWSDFGDRIKAIGEDETDLIPGFKNIANVTVGNLISEINTGLFNGNTKLRKLTLGSGLTAIGDKAFRGCIELTEVVVPPLVETIGASAFAGNSKLASIIMGHSVKTIGEKAFDGCPASTVSITAQTPPTAPNNTFSNYTGQLYVQGEDAVDAYLDAYTCWDRFDGVVMIEPTGIDTGDTPATLKGKPGDTFQLTATLMPENVTLPQVFWRSTNPEIATVDRNGLVTLHADISQLMTLADDSEDPAGRTCKIIAESLYADGPLAEVTVTDTSIPTGIENVFDNGESGDIDFDAPIEVYNIQGVFVSDRMKNLAGGIYIVRQGKNVKKIMVK